MSFFDRLGRVVKAEWNSRFGESPDDEQVRDAAEVDERAPASSRAARAKEAPAPRGRAVSDVESALRVLELTGKPTLDEVRAQYRMLAMRYHPRTRAPSPDQVHAAHTVLEALTDALELLEEHLLPLPAEAGPRR